MLEYFVFDKVAVESGMGNAVGIPAIPAIFAGIPAMAA